MHQENISRYADGLYLVLAGIFIASLVACNLIFQKFFTLSVWVPFYGLFTFEQSVGILPYPITFLVTDILSEICIGIFFKVENKGICMVGKKK